VEGILEPIAQLLNWILIGVAVVAAVKVIALIAKDPVLKRRIFGSKSSSSSVTTPLVGAATAPKGSRFKYDTEDISRISLELK